MSPDDFKPIILPEHPAPSHALNCTRCELACQRKRVIWGEGNPEAPLFIVLDNPGAREDKEDQPFLCGTRETLQYGIFQAGLKRDQVYVTYLLKCRPIRAYDKPVAREACFPHLQLQLETLRPAVMLGLGNTAAAFLLNDDEATVKAWRGKWAEAYGIPAAFSYHPLAVRRRPVLMKHFVEDLKFVRSALVKA